MTTLFQYSHFWAVNHGAYDGDLRISDLAAHGNTGLGTFNGLDGELVLINHKPYHCSAGRARLAREDEPLAWCAVASLSATTTLTLSGIDNMDQLAQTLRSSFPSTNYPYVISINGLFNNLKVGSVPKQQKPYLPIATVIKESLYFETSAIEASLVGFYAPAFLYPIKSTGLHFHFVSNDLQQGGHILDCQIENAIVTFQRIEKIELQLPTIVDYQQMDLPAPNSQNVSVFEDKLAYIGSAE